MPAVTNGTGRVKCRDHAAIRRSAGSSSRAVREKLPSRPRPGRVPNVGVEFLVQREDLRGKIAAERVPELDTAPALESVLLVVRERRAPGRCACRRNSFRARRKFPSPGVAVDARAGRDGCATRGDVDRAADPWYRWNPSLVERVTAFTPKPIEIGQEARSRGRRRGLVA